MSNRRYLEIYSARRNRNRYPYVSQFNIPIEQTGLKDNSRDALDPVVNSFPFYTFKLSTAATPNPPPFPLTFSGGSKSFPQLDSNSSTSLINDFYNGYHLTDITLGETRVITNYEGSTQICTLDSPFSSTWAVGDQYLIRDPSIPLATVVLGTKGGNETIPQITITSVSPLPNYAPNAFPNGYFIGVFLQIIDGTGNTVEQRLISDFINIGGATYSITLNNSFSNTAWTTPGTTLKIQVNLITNPLEKGINSLIAIHPFPFLNLQPVDVYGVKNPGVFDDSFNGSIVYFEKTGEYHFINYYNANLKVATLDNGFTSFNPNTDMDAIFTLRREPPSFRGTFPNNNNTSTTLFVNPATAPPENGAWNGRYIYILPKGFGLNDIPNSKNIYRIEAYYGAVPPTSPPRNPCFPNIIPPPYDPPKQPYSIEINGSITGIPVPVLGDQFEILEFSYDNFAPFSYNGSTVSQNQETCYEISLLSVTIPNLTLISGGNFYYYPYLYVELSTLNSANNNSSQTIYSNNPNSNRALFIAPVPNYSEPLNRQFIQLNTNGMTQTVKFKPNDNLKFSVFLPNGELYIPSIPDNYSPLPPRSLIQIEAVFSLKRLT